MTKSMEQKIKEYFKTHKGVWVTTNEIGKEIDEPTRSVANYIRGIDRLEKKVLTSHKRYYKYV